MGWHNGPASTKYRQKTVDGIGKTVEPEQYSDLDGTFQALNQWMELNNMYESILPLSLSELSTISLDRWKSLHWLNGRILISLWAQESIELFVSLVSELESISQIMSSGYPFAKKESDTCYKWIWKRTENSFKNMQQVNMQLGQGFDFFNGQGFGVDILNLFIY